MTHTNCRPKRTEKLQLLLNDDELLVIDDWRFKHRMPTRAAALRELIRRGLMADAEADIDGSGAASGDFGVIKTAR